MAKWEYSTLLIEEEEEWKPQLNSYGSEGWELVSVVQCPNPKCMAAFFKRPLLITINCRYCDHEVHGLDACGYGDGLTIETYCGCKGKPFGIRGENMLDEKELTLYGRITQIESEIKRLTELTDMAAKAGTVDYRETSEEREAKLANMKADHARWEALREKEEKVKHILLDKMLDSANNPAFLADLVKAYRELR